MGDTEGRVYDIANPSDKCTMRGERDACIVATLLLGERAYALTDVETGEDVLPIMLVATPEALDEWIGEHLGVAGSGLADYVREHRAPIADALASVVIGRRDVYEIALAHIPAAEQAAFGAEWHDAQRTSMNDIGARAWAMAENLRAKEAEGKAEDGPEGDDDG